MSTLLSTDLIFSPYPSQYQITDAEAAYLEGLRGLSGSGGGLSGLSGDDGGWDPLVVGSLIPVGEDTGTQVVAASPPRQRPVAPVPVAPVGEGGTLASMMADLIEQQQRKGAEEEPPVVMDLPPTYLYSSFFDRIAQQGAETCERRRRQQRRPLPSGGGGGEEEYQPSETEPEMEDSQLFGVGGGVKRRRRARLVVAERMEAAATTTIEVEQQPQQPAPVAPAASGEVVEIDGASYVRLRSEQEMTAAQRMDRALTVTLQLRLAQLGDAVEELLGERLLTETPSPPLRLRGLTGTGRRIRTKLELLEACNDRMAALTRRCQLTRERWARPATPDLA